MRKTPPCFKKLLNVALSVVLACGLLPVNAVAAEGDPQAETTCQTATDHVYVNGSCKYCDADAPALIAAIDAPGVELSIVHSSQYDASSDQWTVDAQGNLVASPTAEHPYAALTLKIDAPAVFDLSFDWSVEGGEASYFSVQNVNKAESWLGGFDRSSLSGHYATEDQANYYTTYLQLTYGQYTGSRVMSRDERLYAYDGLAPAVETAPGSVTISNLTIAPKSFQVVYGPQNVAFTCDYYGQLTFEGTGIDSDGQLLGTYYRLYVNAGSGIGGSGIAPLTALTTGVVVLADAGDPDNVDKYTYWIADTEALSASNNTIMGGAAMLRINLDAQNDAFVQSVKLNGAEDDPNLTFSPESNMIVLRGLTSTSMLQIATTSSVEPELEAAQVGAANTRYTAVEKNESDYDSLWMKAFSAYVGFGENKLSSEGMGIMTSLAQGDDGTYYAAGVIVYDPWVALADDAVDHFDYVVRNGERWPMYSPYLLQLTLQDDGSFAKKGAQPLTGYVDPNDSTILYNTDDRTTNVLLNLEYDESFLAVSDAFTVSYLSGIAMGMTYPGINGIWPEQGESVLLMGNPKESFPEGAQYVVSGDDQWLAAQNSSSLRFSSSAEILMPSSATVRCSVDNATVLPDCATEGHWYFNGACSTCGQSAPEDFAAVFADVSNVAISVDNYESRNVTYGERSLSLVQANSQSPLFMGGMKSDNQFTLAFDWSLEGMSSDSSILVGVYEVADGARGNEVYRINESGLTANDSVQWTLSAGTYLFEAQYFSRAPKGGGSGQVVISNLRTVSQGSQDGPSDSEEVTCTYDEETGVVTASGAGLLTSEALRQYDREKTLVIASDVKGIERGALNHASFDNVYCEANIPAVDNGRLVWHAHALCGWSEEVVPETCTTSPMIIKTCVYEGCGKTFTQYTGYGMPSHKYKDGIACTVCGETGPDFLKALSMPGVSINQTSTCYNVGYTEEGGTPAMLLEEKSSFIIRFASEDAFTLSYDWALTDLDGTGNLIATIYESDYSTFACEQLRTPSGSGSGKQSVSLPAGEYWLEMTVSGIQVPYEDSSSSASGSGSGGMMRVPTSAVANISNVRTVAKVPSNIAWDMEDGVMTISGTGVFYADDVDETAYSARALVIESGVTGVESGSHDLNFGIFYPLDYVSLPDTLTNLDPEAFRWTSVKEFIVDDENPAYYTDGRALFAKGENKIVLGARDGSDYEIPEGITTIGANAFYGWTNSSRSLIIPSTVTAVEANAFAPQDLPNSAPKMHVFYDNAEGNHNAIAIGQGNEGLESALWHYHAPCGWTRTGGATCTQGGDVTFTCSADNCDISYVEREKPLSHRFVDGVCERCNADIPAVLAAFDIPNAVILSRNNYDSEDFAVSDNTVTFNPDGYSTVSPLSLSFDVEIERESTLSFQWEIVGGTDDAYLRARLHDNSNGYQYLNFTSSELGVHTESATLPAGTYGIVFDFGSPNMKEDALTSRLMVSNLSLIAPDTSETYYAVLYDTNADGVGDNMVFQASDQAVVDHGTKLDAVSFKANEAFSCDVTGSGNEHPVPWKQWLSKLATVSFDTVVKPVSMAGWFQDLGWSLDGDESPRSYATIDFRNLDTSCVTNMECAFMGTAVENLDLSSFDTSSLVNMAFMFNGCSKLATIYAAPGFSMESISTEWDGVFRYCPMLVGGAGTTYASLAGEGDQDPQGGWAQYARVDGGAEKPGLFTVKVVSGNVELEDKEVGASVTIEAGNTDDYSDYQLSVENVSATDQGETIAQAVAAQMAVNDSAVRSVSIEVSLTCDGEDAELQEGDTATMKVPVPEEWTEVENWQDALKVYAVEQNAEGASEVAGLQALSAPEPGVTLVEVKDAVIALNEQTGEYSVSFAIAKTGYYCIALLDAEQVIGEYELGDLNKNGLVNIIDAQIAYDLAVGRYDVVSDDGSRVQYAEYLPKAGWNMATLMAAANVNDDDAIDSGDAFSIQYRIHYGKWGSKN